MTRLRLFLVALVSMWVANATAQSNPEAVTQSIIKNQIEAFLKDDSETAYGFAAPNIKSFFPNALAFMSMVRNAYKPVYRPRAYQFSSSQGDDTQRLQRVLIEGPTGISYEALYQLIKLESGDWRIAGVYLKKLPGADT